MRLAESYMALKKWKEALDLFNGLPEASPEARNECRRHLAVATESEELPEADWKDTALLLPSGSPSNWTSVVSGEAFAASDHANKKALPADSLFRNFPVALLSATD